MVLLLFLQWIYILTNERNLQNEHFGRNYFNFEKKDSEADLKGPSKENEEYLDDEEFEGNRDEQIFDFVEIPSFVTLLTAFNAEPLYLLKITEKEKGISDGTLTDTWCHVALPGLRYLKGNYLKPVCSRNISFKKFDMSVIITPDKV